MEEYESQFDRPEKILLLESQYNPSDTAIGIKQIFRTILKDQEFLSQQYEEEKIESQKKNRDLFYQISGKFQLLNPRQKQHSKEFPNIFHKLFGKEVDCFRFGIQRVQINHQTDVQKNISFITSLNILLFPDLTKHKYSVLFDKNEDLTNHLSERIRINYRIHKTKNTKEMQKTNAKLIDLLNMGKIVSDIIQYVADSFEVNILVFDFNKSTTDFYWCYCSQFPFMNLYVPLFVFYKDGEFYEPIISKAPWNVTKIYPKILVYSQDLIMNKKIELSVIQYDILKSKEFNVSTNDYLTILSLFGINLTLPPGVYPKEPKNKFKKN